MDTSSSMGQRQKAIIDFSVLARKSNAQTAMCMVERMTIHSVLNNVRLGGREISECFHRCYVLQYWCKKRLN